MVKVRALKENVKRDIVHVPSGFKFNTEGIADWPDDGFTKRRIKDGDVEYVEAKAKAGEIKDTDTRRRRTIEQKPPEPR